MKPVFPRRKQRPDVKVGQVWKDRDKRSSGRRLRVEYVVPTADGPEVAGVLNLENGHKTVVSCRSLQTRFDLVEGATS